MKTIENSVEVKEKGKNAYNISWMSGSEISNVEQWKRERETQRAI